MVNLVNPSLRPNESQLLSWVFYHSSWNWNCQEELIQWWLFGCCRWSNHGCQIFSV